LQNKQVFITRADAPRKISVNTSIENGKLVVCSEWVYVTRRV